jgi:hypothetical protein
LYFLLKFEQFHEYLIQHSLKSGGTKYHFRRVKVPGTTPYWKACNKFDTYLFFSYISETYSHKYRVNLIDIVSVTPLSICWFLTDLNANLFIFNNQIYRFPWIIFRANTKRIHSVFLTLSSILSKLFHLNAQSLKTVL